MKLLVETSLESYLVALINNDKVIDYIFYEQLIKKSDALDKDVKSLLKKNSLNIKNLKEIYVTDGPGSFMGVRAGLIYGYTLAKILKINFYTTSSLEFISGNKPGKYYVDAKGGKSYFLDFPHEKIEIVNFQKNSVFNLQDFKENPTNYLNLFKKTDRLVANYVKEPKIG